MLLVGFEKWRPFTSRRTCCCSRWIATRFVPFVLHVGCHKESLVPLCYFITLWHTRGLKHVLVPSWYWVHTLCQVTWVVQWHSRYENRSSETGCWNWEVRSLVRVTLASKNRLEHLEYPGEDVAVNKQIEVASNPSFLVSRNWSLEEANLIEEEIE